MHLFDNAFLGQQDHPRSHIIHTPQDLHHFTRTIYGAIPNPAVIAIGLNPNHEILHHHYFPTTHSPIPIVFRESLLAYPSVALVAIIHHAHTQEWEPLDRHLSTKYLLAGHLLELPLLDYLKSSSTGYTSLRHTLPSSSRTDNLPFLLPPPPRNTSWMQN